MKFLAGRYSELILASTSPARKALLTGLGLPFRAEPPGVDESVAGGLPPQQAVAMLAERKARAVWAKHEHALVIGSDQLVGLDGKAVGKPKDAGGRARAARGAQRPHPPNLHRGLRRRPGLPLHRGRRREADGVAADGGRARRRRRAGRVGRLRGQLPRRRQEPGHLQGHRGRPHRHPGSADDAAGAAVARSGGRLLPVITRPART